MELILYSTVGCHLCEEAQKRIHAALGQTVAEIDIADDPRLMKRYEIRIPVLARLDTGDEIGWPFEVADIQTLAAGGH